MDLNKIIGDLFRDYGWKLNDIKNMRVGDLVVIHDELTSKYKPIVERNTFERIYETISDMQEQVADLEAFNKSQIYLNNYMIQILDRLEEDNKRMSGEDFFNSI